MFQDKLSEFNQYRSKFNKIVIWGLRTKRHTHRHIHKSFFNNLKKIGDKKILWVDDEIENNKLIEANDLVISIGLAGKFLEVRSDVFYCLHNFENNIVAEQNRSSVIQLQVYTNSVEKIPGIIEWKDAVFFNPKTRCLYQPWGTDLLENEFKKPVFNKNSRLAFFVGSVWNNELNQGNVNEINQLKNIFVKHGMRFVCLRHIPDIVNVFLMRKSRIAPAISGAWQADNDYLPCRMFKNISYGQLGISNCRKFKDILKDYWVDYGSLEDLIEKSLNLKEEEYLKMVKGQQEMIKDYTYIDSLTNIMKAFI